jgi:hypothetical protein
MNLRKQRRKYLRLLQDTEAHIAHLTPLAADEPEPPPFRDVWRLGPLLKGEYKCRMENQYLSPAVRLQAARLLLELLRENPPPPVPQKRKAAPSPPRKRKAAPSNERGADNKPGPYRGVLVDEMRAFLKANTTADARAVRKHARNWFKRTYPGKVLPPRTLHDYYDIAIGGN